MPNPGESHSWRMKEAYVDLDHTTYNVKPWGISHRDKLSRTCKQKYLWIRPGKEDLLSSTVENHCLFGIQIGPVYSQNKAPIDILRWMPSFPDSKGTAEARAGNCFSARVSQDR